MAAWWVALLAPAFVAGLFWIAHRGERQAGAWLWQRHGGLLYSLTLAVYCTSWTYYGAVGTAVTQGWDYVPIYLGPLLIFLFAQPLLHKLLRVVRKHNITSVADFVAARYGKRRHLALLVTLICLLIVLPYIALQLQAVAISYQVLLAGSSDTDAPGWLRDGALPSAIALAFFAMVFGTRQVQLTEPNRGVMLAIAFESLVKLLVLVLLAVVVYVLILDADPGIWAGFWQHATARQHSGDGNWTALVTKTVLAMSAILLLPRQFHVAFVENSSAGNLRAARRWFAGYLILVTLVVVPLAMAGMMLFPDDLEAADSFVLLIPASSDWQLLSVLVFIGGFSAATAMIIVATLALTTMLSNDVIMPALLRNGSHNTTQRDFSALLPRVRRLSIVLIMLLAWLYYQVFARRYGLAETGLLTFALTIQLAPAVIGGLYWRGGNAWGVYAGLLLGCLLWFITLMVPQLVSIGWLDEALLRRGLFGASWLQPQALLGLQLDSLSHGVLWSLSANVFAYVTVSRMSSVPLQDRLQAAVFVQPEQSTRSGSQRRVAVGREDLHVLLERFLGEQRASESMQAFDHGQQRQVTATASAQVADPALISHVERELSGVIGAASAAAMVQAVLQGRELQLEDVVMLFDGTAQAMQFSRQILFATLDNLSQGVSVVDHELKLVAWNRAYLALFDYPEGMIRVGRPIAEIVRLNAERALCGPGDPDEHVSKRIGHMRDGTAHVFQRVWPDGRVIEMRGNPIPGGGFVTSFADVSEHVKALRELAVAKQYLEERVAERTRTISDINRELRAEVERRRQTEEALRQATADAEAANRSKTRFLALASHDILQPLNASRLFAAALLQQAGDDERGQLVRQLDSSLSATETLISTLLEIAQLDDGRLRPTASLVALDELLPALRDEYALLARQKSLRLHVYCPPGLQVRTDATCLRRILQNMLSNAVKYTATGGVLLSCRRRGEQLLLQVWDTGPGISEADQTRIFDDFVRIEATARSQPGIGLGLAVVQRMASLLQLPLTVKSRNGRGTTFSLVLPLAESHSAAATAPRRLRLGAGNMRLVCLDDDEASLQALQSLLQQWQVTQVERFSVVDDLLQYAAATPAPHLLLLDYQLGEVRDGLAVHAALQQYWPRVTAVLVSAAADTGLPARARAAGMMFLRKPIRPAALRACLMQARQQRG